MTMDMTEKELEAAADRLLAEADPDPDYPAYTQRTLVRRARRREAPLDSLQSGLTEPEDPLAGITTELLHGLLGSLGLPAGDAAALGLHLLGWSQDEIAAITNTTQQSVARLIERCLSPERSPRNGDPHAGWYQVYLEEVHRTIYRKPSRTRDLPLAKRHNL